MSRNLPHNSFKVKMSCFTLYHMQDSWKTTGKRLVLETWTWFKILCNNVWCQHLLVDFSGLTLLSNLLYSNYVTVFISFSALTRSTQTPGTGSHHSPLYIFTRYRCSIRSQCSKISMSGLNAGFAAVWVWTSYIAPLGALAVKWRSSNRGLGADWH